MYTFLLLFLLLVVVLLFMICNNYVLYKILYYIYLMEKQNK